MSVVEKSVHIGSCAVTALPNHSCSNGHDPVYWHGDSEQCWICGGNSIAKPETDVITMILTEMGL